MKSKLLPWLIPIAVLAIWYLTTANGYVSSDTLPKPMDVVRAFIDLTKDGTLPTNIGISAQRAITGFLIGGSIGFVLGFINGLSHLLYKLTDSTIQMIRNIPHLALLPLIAVWFGIGEDGKLFLIALGVFYPIYINTYHGIRNVDPNLIEMGKVYGLKRLPLLWNIVLPGALSSILVGIRFSLGVMWLTLIVAETVAANSGIGYMAMNARDFMQMDIIVLSILIYGILGKISDMIAKLLESVFLKWKHY